MVDKKTANNETGAKEQLPLSMDSKTSVVLPVPRAMEKKESAIFNAKDELSSVVNSIERQMSVEQKKNNALVDELT